MKFDPARFAALRSRTSNEARGETPAASAEASLEAATRTDREHPVTEQHKRLAAQAEARSKIAQAAKSPEKAQTAAVAPEAPSKSIDEQEAEIKAKREAEELARFQDAATNFTPVIAPVASRPDTESLDPLEKQREIQAKLLETRRKRNAS